ncbi:uncharacterized protein LOC116207738 [Punica granatum]|uniref:Uncharacterized protein LOC116207738 n=1 Tax=Punica granatum TaxID=22663 RepID=A0A6P8DK67_PUNGR|nr:uncharacterized protein LOC116207738 [Punica granatum]
MSINLLKDCGVVGGCTWSDLLPDSTSCCIRRFKLAYTFHVKSMSLDVGRSLLGGLGSHLPASLRSPQCLTNGYCFSQLRTFIQTRTVLNVEDNSGAIKVMCIQAVKGKKWARLGETIAVSVKKAKSKGKVKKGNVCCAVVVRAAMDEARCDVSKVKFDDNACVLVEEPGKWFGTRVFRPVPRELRKKNHIKILSLAEHIV